MRDALDADGSPVGQTLNGKLSPDGAFVWLAT
jgi:hypothetical protein